MTIDELIAKLEAASEGSRELDMAIGKAIGAIPLDAIWGTGAHIDGDLAEQVEELERNLGAWTTPAHNEYRRQFREFSAAVRSDAECRQWDAEHPIPGLDDNSKLYWRGNAARYTTLLDAALTLVPEGCRYTIEQSIEGKWFDVYIFRFGENDEFIGDTEVGVKTAPLAFCIAALKARQAP